MGQRKLLTVKNLVAGYRLQSITKTINWTIHEGEHWHVNGNTASGKTTLLKAIAGQARVFGGKNEFPFLQGEPSFKEIRNHISLVSFTDESKLFRSVNAVHYYQQRYNAFDSDGHLTVREYLKDGGLLEHDDQHQQWIKALSLGPLLDMERIKLSSGQTRKLILCKALLRSPKILLLDNPHIGLDDQSREVFNALIDQLVFQHDMTIILSGWLRTLPRCISHQMQLDNGTVKDIGPLQPQHTTKQIQTTSSAQRYAHDKLRFHYLNAKQEISSEPVISFRNLSVTYAGKSIFSSLDWKINPGEKWCLFGGNGSGKSTIVGLIYGDHPQAYSNDVRIFGRRRGRGESIWQIKNRMGFVSPELHAYFPLDLLVHEVVASGFSDTLYARPVSKSQEEIIDAFLAYFEMENYKTHPWARLSTGQQRIVLFIRALVKAPPLLLLDEPFQGLDASLIEQSKKLLDDILTTKQSLLFISHFRDEIPLCVTKELRL